MGAIRFFLALSVVASHTGFLLFIPGRASVVVFYVISGYLMTLILNNTYTTGCFCILFQ
jgi:peptidoglycan/LPS O-acetylase OafA/YrhL